MLPAQSSARARRKPAVGQDHVKHRRTRSGCYTCRNRRVKCDETHPICERCRKGNRECVYPEPVQNAKSHRAASRTKGSSPGSASSGDEGRDHLPPIPDDDEETPGSSHRASVSNSSHTGREQSNTPSLTHDKSPSPSTESSSVIAHAHPRPVPSRTSSRQNLRRSPMDRTWNELKPDVRYYLEWFRDNITCHHYALKYDGADFMRTTLLDIAVHNDPLLYAVVGFAAYHHTVQRPDGRLQDFLGYYNQSVNLLRVSLQRGQRRSPATLLTILQLATIEEYLGDWVNLIGHQKAAFEIITSLYTPQTVMQNETSRRILLWYVRFDLFGGFLGGNETALARDWFVACAQYYVQQTRDRPEDLNSKFEERLCQCRLFARDVSALFSRTTKGLLDSEAFAAESAAIEQRLAEWYDELDPALMDESKHITDFSGAPPRDPEDIVDPYDPNSMYGGDLFPMNICLIDYWAIVLMFKLQLAMIRRTTPSPDTVTIAFKVCQMFEGLELCPQSPPGILIEAQASLGMGIMFLPKDQKHIMWGRRKFAKVESLGFIHPQALRTRMSETWNADVSRWWLPEDEGYPPIIKSIRGFIEDRTVNPSDQEKQDLRDMKGLFNELSLGEDKFSHTHVENADSFDPSSESFSMDIQAFDEAMIYQESPEFGWNYDSHNSEA
ncbi:uncharacterized protein K452DRAFT_244963 [Aplosporella prunicola CBS 121167]|uniref:Zn(2)-C6 fungal-type domain-containing protein n=1 Tax=Aplosporella prunicola CBS 121167 TaxID=1176127 RepID=A0A6A6BNG1_9PEZI|nr:uncharacterized protein K452DRAFT_244963 [Aplosporella prunicola CBS 121167]KAF2145208.1 hypothetical protein K452DRAFT_244963 [Aplosporella prunicola CBS 121167]